MKTTEVHVFPNSLFPPFAIFHLWVKPRAGDAILILTPLLQVNISFGHLVALHGVLFQSQLSKVIYLVYVLYFTHINHETKSIGNRHSILIIICNLVPQRLSMYRTANKWFKKKNWVIKSCFISSCFHQSMQEWKFSAETGVRDLSLAWKIKTASTKNAFILILSLLETTHASLMYTSWKHLRYVFLL